MSRHVHEMISQVANGANAREVIESSLVFHPGSTARVNKATTAQKYMSDGTVSVPYGTVASIMAVGGGPSGNDHPVLLPDGTQAVIPFNDLGESVEEGLTGAVVKITLTKPLPRSATQWLEGGYVEDGMCIPDVPSNDDQKELTFLMKAADDEAIEIGISRVKRVAGASFKSSAAASLNDWNAITAG